MPKLGLGLSLPQTRVTSAPLIPASGLSLWLRADAGVTIDGNDETAVTAWADQSGNGINASPVDVYPTYNPSDLNGKPTISLSSVGSGSNKSFALSGNPMGASGATAFVVNYVDPAVFPVGGEDDGNANGALLGNFGGATNGSHWPYGLNYPASVYDAFATSTRKNDLGEPANDAIRYWNIYSVYSQNADWKLFCNGIEFAADTTNIYSNAIADSTSLYIGMQNNSATDQIFKGKVAEVVIYNRVLTTPERQQVEAYLMEKYAIAPAPPPSGIPVASTNTVYVDGFTLVKQSSTLYFGDVSEGIEDCGGDQTRDYGNKGQLEFSGGSWSYKYGPYNGCLETWDFSTYTNPSINANFIPTTGWSPAITITAA